VVDGVVVWRNPYHLTRTFATSIGDDFARLLVAEGIVAG
jgi:hypothetical protein